MNRELIDRLRIAVPVAIVSLLSGVGVVAVFFSGLLPSGLTGETVVPAGVVQLLVGAVLVGAGVVYLRQTDHETDHDRSLVDTAMPPERPKRPPRVVGEQFDTAVENALRDVRLKDVAYNTTVPHQQLSATVEQILSLRGHDSEQIEQQLSAGDWTTDPVAGGFLSESNEYPVWFNLLRWAKPGIAYRRAIERTTLATQALLDGPIEDSSATTGWFSEFRADVERYLSDESTATGTDRQLDEPAPELEVDP